MSSIVEEMAKYLTVAFIWVSAHWEGNIKTIAFANTGTMGKFNSIDI